MSRAPRKERRREKRKLDSQDAIFAAIQDAASKNPLERKLTKMDILEAREYLDKLTYSNEASKDVLLDALLAARTADAREKLLEAIIDAVGSNQDPAAVKGVMDTVQGMERAFNCMVQGLSKFAKKPGKIKPKAVEDLIKQALSHVHNPSIG